LRSAGFTHVLLAEPVLRSSSDEMADGLSRELEMHGQATILPIDEYLWRDASSTTRRYRLIKLR